VFWSIHVSMLFTELDYLDRPQAAATAGFRAIETWWPPDGLGENWADAVIGLGLEVSSINAYGGSIKDGDRGFLNDAGRRASSVDAFRTAAALAHRVRCPRINLLVGRELPDRPRSAQLAEATSALRECAAIAEHERLEILLEPINELDVPGYLIPTPSAAVEMIDAVGSAHIRMLYDAYHVARAGADPVRDVAAFASWIGHVQFADCPGRGGPGTGEIDLAALLQALTDVRYPGAIGLEFDPRGPTIDALAKLPDRAQERPPRPLEWQPRQQ
jgi:hydroxypyruvate isomerase